MAIIDGWLTWGERRPGIPNKVYSQPNSGEGIAMHSIVGDLPNHAIPGRFLSTERGADGRYTASAAASCMFILYRDGHLVQMYPVTAATWTSGGFDGNTRFWPVEAEGGRNPTTEPLTKAAEDTFIRLVTEWEQHTGRRGLPGSNLLQHKEIARKFGYAATACASDRYSNALVRILAGERYKEESGMKDYEDLLIAVFSGSEEKDLPREQRLANSVYRRDQIVRGEVQSVSDNARSAYALAQANQPPPRVITITGTNMEVQE